jgi:hypothetical protein
VYHNLNAASCALNCVTILNLLGLFEELRLCMLFVDVRAYVITTAATKLYCLSHLSLPPVQTGTLTKDEMLLRGVCAPVDALLFYPGATAHTPASSVEDGEG